MCENVSLVGGAPGERESHFSWENCFFARGRQLLEESLITGKVSLIKLNQITGISIFKLKKYKKRLQQGLPGLAPAALRPRRVAWTQEQVTYLTDPENLLSWGTDSLIKRQSDFQKKFKNEQISVPRLRKLYREVGIKQRVARMDIVLTPS